MKKLIASLMTLTALSTFGIAGDGKYVVDDKAPVPVATACYGTGFEFGVFGAGYFPDGGDHDDSLGGGVSLGYFYTENFGFQASAAIYATDSEVHNYTIDAIYRIPFDCIAPYAIVGGGVHTNSATEGLFRFGGGIDFRIMDGTSVFADGTYNILGGDVEDYTTVRAGLRFAF